MERRSQLLMKEIKLKLQKRKFKSPARGLEKSLQEQNRVVLDAVLAKIQPKA